jgi:hypothetical protein
MAHGTKCGVAFAEGVAFCTRVKSTWESRVMFSWAIQHIAPRCYGSRISLTSTQGKVLKSYGHASEQGRHRQSEGMMSCKKRGCVLH